MVRLPIDIIAEHPRLRFIWQATACGIPTGNRIVGCSGCLPVGIEVAVADLIREYRRLEAENAKLQLECAELKAEMTGTTC
jgi:hypothetical protein